MNNILLESREGYAIREDVLKNCIFNPFVKNPLGFPLADSYPYHVVLESGGGGFASGWFSGIGYTVANSSPNMPKIPSFFFAKESNNPRWTVTLMRDDLHLFGEHGSNEFVDKFIEQALRLNNLEQSKSERRAFSNILELTLQESYAISSKAHEARESLGIITPDDDGLRRIDREGRILAPIQYNTLGEVI